MGSAKSRITAEPSKQPIVTTKLPYASCLMKFFNRHMEIVYMVDQIDVQGEINDPMGILEKSHTVEIHLDSLMRYRKEARTVAKTHPESTSRYLPDLRHHHAVNNNTGFWMAASQMLDASRRNKELSRQISKKGEPIRMQICALLKLQSFLHRPPLSADTMLCICETVRKYHDKVVSISAAIDNYILELRIAKLEEIELEHTKVEIMDKLEMAILDKTKRKFSNQLSDINERLGRNWSKLYCIKKMTKKMIFKIFVYGTLVKVYYRLYRILCIERIEHREEDLKVLRETVDHVLKKNIAIKRMNDTRANDLYYS